MNLVWSSEIRLWHLFSLFNWQEAHGNNILLMLPISLVMCAHVDQSQSKYNIIFVSRTIEADCVAASVVCVGLSVRANGTMNDLGMVIYSTVCGEGNSELSIIIVSGIDDCGSVLFVPPNYPNDMDVPAIASLFTLNIYSWEYSSSAHISQSLRLNSVGNNISHKCPWIYLRYFHPPAERPSIK